MVDSEPDGHAGSDIGRFGDFLKEGADGDCTVEKNMIDDVEQGYYQPAVDKGVGNKYKNECPIFHRKNFLFSKPVDASANKGGKIVIDAVVQEKEDSDFLDGIIEFLHQEEDSKGDKYLATGAGHESEAIIQPVLLPENHLLMLLNAVAVRGILGECPDRGDNDHATEQQVEIGIV